MQITSDILEFCVLSSLKNEDMYGYILTQYIQSKVKISESTLYPVLKRLQKKEMLETYDDSFQGRNRRYYRITLKGIEEFNNFVNKWNIFKNEIDSFIEKGDEND